MAGGWTKKKANGKNATRAESSLNFHINNLMEEQKQPISVGKPKKEFVL